MKKIKHSYFVILSTFFVLFFTSCYHISVEIDADGGGVLEDAILLVSDNGNTPRSSFILGDIDLSKNSFNFTQTVDTAKFTHWWLIGTFNGDVVYSSSLPLNGVDLYSTEPYNGEGAELAWNIPGNIASYAAKEQYSMDWWGATANNHSSHIAPNKSEVTLWRFTNGSKLGTIKVDLKKGS